MAKDNPNITPEKQLLKLIEEPHDRVAGNAVVRGRGFSLPGLGVLAGRLAFAQESFKQLARGWAGPFDIKKINGILSLVAVLVGIYFIAGTIFLSLRMSVVPSFSFKTERPAKGGLGSMSALKSADFYRQKAQARDLFKIGLQAPEPEQSPQGSDLSAQAQEILSKYKLVGISWSDNPDAMIEDTAAQKTYFIKRGQELNGVKVQAIFKDKVVLNYLNKEIELR